MTTTTALLEGLNPEQRTVVEADAGAFKVLAGAGAGKTKALVHRIAYLVQERDVPEGDICAVTFSKKAADEMNDRLRSLGVSKARVGTWHSLALEILKTERPFMADWEIDDKDRFRTIVKTVLGYRGMKWNTADLTTVLGYIGLCKADLAEAGTDAAQEVAQRLFDANPCSQTTPHLLHEAYMQATEAQKQRCLLTFDDMLVGAWRCLKDDSAAREHWGGCYRYVLQDEAQDCNLAQATLAEMLAKGHGNYMIVGDPAQSIYGFRGARPEKLQAFDQEWAPVTVIRMNRNYRSGDEVIAAANRFTRAMAEGTHLGVDMLPERGTSAEVTCRHYATMDQEAEEVVAQLQAAHEDGIEWKEMAVLYRTNAQSRAVEEACLSNRIPYVVLGGTNFYDRKEVKDLLGYLRIADGRGDDDAFRRCINSPFRYLGKRFVEQVQAEKMVDESWPEAVRRVSEKAGIQRRQVTSAKEWAGLVDSLARSIEMRDQLQQAVESPGDDGDDIPASAREVPRDHMPAALLERIVQDTDYLRYITRDEGAETVENNRVSNVRELIRAAERFTTVRELLDYIDETLQAARDAKKRKEVNRVTLCSLHRSKGLEWPLVCVIDANEKILPHGRAEDIEEERRLFYVGMTRARDILHVSHVETATFGERVLDLEPSRFLTEAGLIEETEEPAAATVLDDNAPDNAQMKESV